MYPPIDVAHGWRQSFTCMVARNFYEVDTNILLPRIDYSAGNPDVTTSEFPLFNYIIYLFSLLFDFNCGIGRLVNLIVSTLGVFYFYKLIKGVFDKTTGLYSALVLLVSIWFMFSRKIMPDTFSASLIIFSWFNLWRYYVHKKNVNLILFALFASIGGLTKISSLVMLAPVYLFLFSPKLSRNNKLKLIISGILAFIPIAGWYFVYQPYIGDAYGNHLYFPYSFKNGFKALWEHKADFAEKFYFAALHSFFAIAVVVYSLVMAVKTKMKLLLHIFISVFILFVLFAIKTGEIMPTHSYYIIPFVPVLALLAGWGLQKFPKKNIATVILSLIVIEGTLNQIHDLSYKKSQDYLLNLTAVVEKTSRKNDLIAVNGSLNPQMIYFAHRKGLSLSMDDIQSPNFKNRMIKEKIKYLYFYTHNNSVKIDLPIIYQTDNYIVYRIEK